ncbi:MAG: thioredoxin domain-containing protein [Bacteroidota bacterium]
MNFLKRLLQQDIDNALVATTQLIANLGVSVTKTTIQSVLTEHPEYPSLLSISDSLSKWKIDSQAIRVDPASLDKIPLPFIAHTNTGEGLFLTVTKVTSDTVEYEEPKGGRQKIVQTRDEFMKVWSRTVLIAGADDTSGERDYAQQRQKEWLNTSRFPFLVTGLALLTVLYAVILFYTLGTAGLYQSLLPVIKLAGCIVTGLLLWFEIDQNNSVLKQLCTAGKNTDCKAILKSKEAKLFSWLSWSEIGFFYFAGSLFYSLFSIGHEVSGINLLVWLNALALPYPIFSLYYQWKVAKQWCPLCVMVQALLLIEAVYFGVGYWQTGLYAVLPSVSACFMFLAAFAFSIVLWAAIKPFLLKAQQADTSRKELARLKHNPQLFAALLEKQPPVVANPEGLGITMGNPNARHTIIKVCNPYCGPCAKAHPEVEELLELSNDVKVQIIFTAYQEDNPQTKPVKHLLAIHGKHDENMTKKALDDWYLSPTKDYDAFAALYPMNGELQKQGAKLEAMQQWCEAMQIAFTPTFFVNGHQLPEPYSIQDVKHFVL